jgi:hypothetical protein
MSLAVQTTSHTQNLPAIGRPLQSRLFQELLDRDHDAWHVVRNGRAWSFYREIGHDHPRFPFGSIVLTTEPGKPQSLDFFSGRGRHSLIQTYGPEIAHAAQTLMDRERILEMFNKFAATLSSKHWDQHLSFSGSQLTERTAKLRVGTPTYERIVGTACSRFSRRAFRRGELSMPQTPPGLMVSQFDNEAPLAQCLIAYPRTIEAAFFSSRLREGLYDVTGSMVSMIVRHNREAERQRSFDEGNF